MWETAAYFISLSTILATKQHQASTVKFAKKKITIKSWSLRWSTEKLMSPLPLKKKKTNKQTCTTNALITHGSQL